MKRRSAPEEVRRVAFGGEVIAFAVARTRRKRTVALSVGADGVRVAAPADLPAEELDAIVRRKGRWLLRKLAGLAELGVAPGGPAFVSGETFFYLGRPLRLLVLRRDAGATVTRVRLEGDSLVAPVQDGLDPALERAAVRAGLRSWYVRGAEEHLPARVAVWAARLGVPTPPVLIRDQERRWGSCNARGEVRLNWRVMMAPPPLVDYVVVHELCHLREMNHGPRFWRLVETMMPDYRERREGLRREGARFIF